MRDMVRERRTHAAARVQPALVRPDDRVAVGVWCVLAVLLVAGVLVSVAREMPAGAALPDDYSIVNLTSGQASGPFEGLGEVEITRPSVSGSRTLAYETKSAAEDAQYFERGIEIYDFELDEPVERLDIFHDTGYTAVLSGPELAAPDSGGAPLALAYNFDLVGCAGLPAGGPFAQSEEDPPPPGYSIGDVPEDLGCGRYLIRQTRTSAVEPFDHHQFIGREVLGRSSVSTSGQLVAFPTFHSYAVNDFEPDTSEPPFDMSDRDVYVWTAGSGVGSYEALSVKSNGEFVQHCPDAETSPCSSPEVVLSGNGNVAA